MRKTLNYQRFLKIINFVAKTNPVNTIPANVGKLTFLKILADFNMEDTALGSYLKTKILHETNFSIKISRDFLNSKIKNYYQEGEFIRKQIKEFYNSSSIRIIDLAYLIIFFQSKFYEDLINKLDFVSYRRHQMLQNFEELYYITLDIEICLILTDPKLLYKALEETKVYNLNIHNHIINITEHATNEICKLKYYKKLYEIVKKNCILFTTNEEKLKAAKEKLDKFENVNFLRFFNQTYKSNDLPLQNLETNMHEILTIFKTQFYSKTFISEQIQLMETFATMMLYKNFVENISSERLKIYDHLFSILQIKTTKESYKQEIISYAEKLIDLIFKNENDIFVETLRKKVLDLKKLKIKQEFYSDLKLITTQGYKLVLNNKLLPDKLNDAFDNDTNVKIIKKLVKSLVSFLNIIKIIDDYEYVLFEMDVEIIFNILQKIINLKIKYFIHTGVEVKLGEAINNLNYKFLKHKLLILKLESSNFQDLKLSMKENLQLCKIERITIFYLNNCLKPKNLKISIRSYKDLSNYFYNISEIFFDRALFILPGYKVLENLFNTYERLKKIFLITENISNFDIHKLFKNLKMYCALKKGLPKYIKLRHPIKTKNIKNSLIDYFYKNEDLLKHPSESVKDTITLFKVGKKILKKEIALDFQDIKSISDIKLIIDSWNLKLNQYLIGQQDFFDLEDFLLCTKEICKNLRMHKRMSKILRNIKSEHVDINKEEIQNSKFNLKFIRYHFKMNKIDWLLNNAKENYPCLDKLKLVKELIVYNDYISEYNNISDIIRKHSEIDIVEHLSRLRILQDFNYKVKNIESDIVNLKILDKQKIEFDNKNELYQCIEQVDYKLKDMLLEINIVSQTPELHTKCIEIKNTLEKLMETTNKIYFILNDICKFGNINLFAHFVNELHKLLIETNLNEIVIENEQFKNVYVKQIEDLKNRISDLYFVSNDDLINFVNRNLLVEYLLKNLYKIDNLIIVKDRILGLINKKDKIYFLSNIEYKNEFRTPEEFELFYNQFKNELKKVLVSYVQNKSKKDKIEFLDDFINESRYFSGKEYDDTIKIQFIKKHQSEIGQDFDLLYPTPVIKKYNKLYTDSLQMTPFTLTYYPPSNIIYTKLTNTVFNKISLALNYYSGVILYGESSTGKTETVKYYCRSIGQPLYVFCCNENLDISLLENIIKGCLKNSFFLCLDECNRLNTAVMSQLSSLILDFRDKIKIFLTLNIGYLGRNRLPTTLKTLFAEIRVDNPDIDDILDIFFSKEMKELFYNLRENSGNMSHYNFSLRALNTILCNYKSISKDELQLQTNFNEKDTIQFNLSRNDLNNNLLIYYYAIFNNKDKGLLEKYMPSLSKQELFNYGIDKNTGILLYGESLTGKSKLIREMIKIRNVRYVILHHYDENVLYGLIKKHFNDSLWIIYDCILESKWIENLNSILDDNKIFCMQNGEIIKIGENIKFIFETNDIKKLTPATLTRVFTIYFETSIKCKNEFLENNKNVIFLEGPIGSGKKTYFEKELKKGEVTYLNCRVIKSLYSYNGTIFLEEYERASDGVIQELKEYYEFETIKDVKKDMEIVVSYNGKEPLSDFNYKRRINCKIIKFKEKFIKQYDLKTEDQKFLELILQPNSPICNYKIVEFCINHNLNFILVGKRLSGKNWLLKDFNIQIVEIFNETCTIQYDDQRPTAILTDDQNLLSHSIIKENLLIKLHSPTKFIFDWKNYVKDGFKDYLQYIRNIELKSCGCCIDKEINGNETEIYNQCISFQNIYKLTDFIDTLITAHIDFMKTKKFILNGLEKIEFFSNISKEKKFNLHEQEIFLKKYQEEINEKVAEISKLQIESELEKTLIKNKKQEQLLWYDEIEKKKVFINQKLLDGEIKLAESINKITKITKKNISEIRSMNNPPKAVHFIMNIIIDMVNNKKVHKTWNECLLFLKSFDVNSVVNKINMDIVDINQLKEKEKEIQKSSYVCYLFYEWIINNHEYTKLKEEIKPLEEEVRDLIQKGDMAIINIKKEEDKVKKLEMKLVEYQNEYENCIKLLDDTENEIRNLKDDITKYEYLLEKINEEKDKWTIPIFNLDLVYKILHKNKVILSKAYTDEYFIVDMKDDNYKKVLSTLSKYKRNVVICNCTKDEEVYKLCKALIKDKNFTVLLFQENTTFYDCIGYKHDMIEEYKYEEDINIKEFQDNLLVNIVEGDLNKILEAKSLLDIQREKQKNIENIKKVYSNLNQAYRILYDKFELSFKVYDDFISKNEHLKTLPVEEIVDMSSKYITEFNLEDVGRYDSNILIITNTDDFIYYLEKNLSFKNVICLGDNKTNKVFETLLSTGNNLYLIKNIDLYNRPIEDKSNNKFIFISEYYRSKRLVKNCKIMYMKYKFDYTRSIELYRKLYTEENDDIIKYHCRIIRNLYLNKLERKYNFTVRDLELIINYKNIISMEYLRYLVYNNKLDKCDIEKVTK